MSRYNRHDPQSLARPVVDRPLRIACTLVVAATLWLPSVLATEHAFLERALSSITSEDLTEVVSVLADDTMEGREAGTRGGHAASGYLLQRLVRLKLQPAGEEGTYVQTFGADYRNVLAILPGSDPELAREVVVVGAHYDHVGYGTRRNSYGPIGYIHNGADDNASGTAAVLEIAEALLQLPEPPARTILFAFWDGEEKGLLGSKHWLAHPTIDRSRLVFAFNFDMIGRLRNDRLEVYGAHTAKDVRALLLRSNHDPTLRLDFRWKMKADSDHHVFFSYDIPVVMFHTGLHENYHRPSDDVETLNTEGMERVTRFALESVIQIADRDTSVSFREASQWEDVSTPERLLAEAPPRRLRLGIWWSVDDSSEYPLVVSRVVPGSPAEQAGVQPGDRVMRLGETAIHSEAAMRRTVDESSGETVLVVRRFGHAEPLELSVALAGPPRLLGILLRDDPANPSVRIVTFVDPASPAAKAGLRVGDRLYGINGRRFGAGDDHAILDPDAQGRWRCQVERNGRLVELVAERLQVAHSSDEPSQQPAETNADVTN